MLVFAQLAFNKALLKTVVIYLSKCCRNSDKVC